MQIEKVNKTPPLGQQAYERLKEAILCGRLAPGYRLTEAKAADFLGVSRTPAREALRFLGQEGILDTRKLGGYLIPTPSLDKLTRITEVRKLLEPHAAGLTADRITDGEIVQLREVIDREWSVIDDLTPGVFVGANCSVRALLYNLCGNEQLIDCIDRYSSHLQFIGTKTLTNHDIREVAVNGHERIYECVAKHDREGAAAATVKQIEAALAAAKVTLGGPATG